jgi:hypothetical protein
VEVVKKRTMEKGVKSGTGVNPLEKIRGRRKKKKRKKQSPVPSIVPRKDPPVTYRKTKMELMNSNPPPLTQGLRRGAGQTLE